MSATSKLKGHGHQVSVADAATLFGSAADDPFSSILGSDPALGGVAEEAEEEEPAPAVKAELPAAAASIDDAAVRTPKAPITALPETATPSLELPTSHTDGQSHSASSPSALFTTSATMTNFFSANNNDDNWLGQNGEADHPNHDVATGQNGHQEPQQAFDYYGEGNGGAAADIGYDYYQHDQTQYGEHQQPINGYAQGTEYQNGTYQQHEQYQQEQYGQYDQNIAHHEAYAERYDQSQQHPQAYDQTAGQYDQYTEQQQGYDPSAYGYGEQAYDESLGSYQHDAQPQAEQYNQYDPSMGQPTSYHQQQQYDPSMNQYDPSNHQQHSYEPAYAQYSQDDQQQYAYDPSSEQYDYNTQQHQPYDPALYAQAQEESLDSLGYTAQERAAQEGVQEGEAFQHYNTAAEEGLRADPSLEAEHQLAASYPPDDYTGDHSQKDAVTEKYASSYDASPLPPAAPFAAGPQFPSATDDEDTDFYSHSGQEGNAASYTHEPLATDDMFEQQPEQHQAYAEYSGVGNAPQNGHYIDSYSETEGLRGDGHYDQTGGPSGYFDNLAVPPVLHTEEEEGPYSNRTLDVTSPYDPRLASAGFSSMGEAVCTSQDRTLDAAEERHRAKIPLASFSIDGKLLTFFPTWSQNASEDAYANGGGGYAMGGSAAPTKVTIRPLRSVVPATSYASSKNPLDFPGPALEGDTSQGSALSRATGASASSSKAKKTALIKYLNDAAADMASGISYLAAGKHASVARKTRDRILLIRMLVLLLEHDGNLVNNAAFDTAAKDVLLADQDVAPLDNGLPSEVDRSPTPGPSADQKVGFLNRMEGLLMAGQRKEAVDLAVREKMWTHAVVIASGMDRSTWREVVGQFVEDEFEQSAAGHQGLKVAYHLFSGQEPKTTYDLFRRKTSLSPDNAQSQDGEADIPLTQWRKSVATILANRSNGDSATLTAIGDGLAISGWIEAAHVCYLLSPQTSPMDGYDGGSSRLTLLGANSPEASTLYTRDLDHIILTEIFEYALSLQPVAKGAEAYHGLAYLQSYRLVHAYLLAEMGETKRAIRYCDSIMILLKHGKMNRYYHPVLLHQLQELSNRLQGDTKSTSWTKKKPTMDGVWSALEGRFTKFIAGEEGTAADQSSRAKGGAGPAVGPFSHYSAITPDARVGGVSRVQSTSDFRSVHPMSTLTTTSRPQSRPTSALSLHPPHPISAGARSVSEYGTGAWTPPARDSSALSSPKQQSIGRASSDADMFNGPFTSHSTSAAPWGAAEDGQTYQPANTAYYGYEPHGASQPQFISNVDDDLSNSMKRASIDDHRGATVNSYQSQGGDDDEDDLGFGNKSTKAKADMQNGSKEGDDKQKQEVATPEKKKDGELKPASSWFALPKLWGRSAASEAGEAKAKKAHLGESSTFYYDKDLKKWVNGKAGDTGQAAAPPPPPPRAQTASPSIMGGNMPSSIADAASRRVTSDMRPPPSTASSISTPSISEAGEDGNDTSPTKSSMRARSNLADLSQPPALQPGPPVRPGTTSEGGPPRAVSSSAIKKKPIKSRYVNVL